MAVPRALEGRLFCLTLLFFSTRSLHAVCNAPSTWAIDGEPYLTIANETDFATFGLFEAE